MIYFKDAMGNEYTKSIPFNNYGPNNPSNIYIDGERFGVTAGKSYDKSRKTFNISFKGSIGHYEFTTSEVERRMPNLTLEELLSLGKKY